MSGVRLRSGAAVALFLELAGCAAEPARGSTTTPHVPVAPSDSAKQGSGLEPSGSTTASSSGNSVAPAPPAASAPHERTPAPLGGGAATSDRTRAAQFPPPDFTPPSARSAEPGDGQWKPYGDATSGEPLLVRTRVHPHETSRFITLDVVALDLERARLEFLPGVDDVGKQPVPFEPGLVPERDRRELIAAFNGGFMPRHGRWGMRVGDVTVLPPREPGCTLAILANDEVRLRSWPVLAAASAELRAVRQTPPCLVEQGTVNPALVAGRDKPWAGQTPGLVTRRRSAVGLSADGRILFYAIGVETTAKLLALGMQAAGAFDAAQLDINWNWTRFLLYGTNAEGKRRVTATLAEVEHTPLDYVEIASKRDFFYVVRGTAKQPAESR